MCLIAFAMFATAISMKPSATCFGRAALAGGALDVVRECGETFCHRLHVERLIRIWSEHCGKNSGWILPSITLQSVTVSGPPRR